MSSKPTPLASAIAVTNVFPEVQISSETLTSVPPKAASLISTITVNGKSIEEADILHEVQNHPATSSQEALQAATRALVVRELLWQEAQRLALTGDENSLDDQHETRIDAAIGKLIEQQLSVPEASEVECRRYYDNNQKRFLSQPLFEARHILIAAAHDDANTR